MDARTWLETITADQPGTVAKKAGIPRRTIYHQLERGTFPIDSIIKITDAYGTNPIDALMEIGIIDRAWANVPDVVAALRLATDDQLTDEILRRLKLGSRSFDTPVDDLAARRSNTTTPAIRPVVDDDDPTAGIDWRDYAAHPKTEPLEEDNPTP